MKFRKEYLELTYDGKDLGRVFFAHSFDGGHIHKDRDAQCYCVHFDTEPTVYRCKTFAEAKAFVERRRDE